MRILLFFALIIIAAGGYLAYFNKGEITINLSDAHQYDVAIIPLLLGCVALGLLMGLMGTLWSDTKGFFRRIGAKRRMKHSDRIRTLMLEADRERLAGRIQRAKDRYRKITKLDPEHTGAISALGDIARNAGAGKEAVELHRLAFRLDPEHPAHRLAMVDDYMSMGAYESAAQMIEPGLDEDGKNQSLLTRLRDCRVALREWDAAAEAQQRLMQSPMDGLDSRQEKARLNGYRYEAAMVQLGNGQTDLGRNGLNKLIREASNFSPAYISLADLLMREGKVQDALSLLRAGYEQTRDESFLPRIENILIVHLEDPREALRYFSSLVERDPKSLRLRYYLGHIYYRLEMIDDALHVLTQLEQQVDAFPELSELLGRINLKRGKVGEATVALADTEPRTNYACIHCRIPTAGWQAGCEACGSWGTIAPKLNLQPEEGPGTPETTILLPAPA